MLAAICISVAKAPLSRNSSGLSGHSKPAVNLPGIGAKILVGLDFELAGIGQFHRYVRRHTGRAGR
jgi:hypothetical protein